VGNTKIYRRETMLATQASSRLGRQLDVFGVNELQ
jgi:hypothetical protein